MYIPAENILEFPHPILVREMLRRLPIPSRNHRQYIRTGYQRPTGFTKLELFILVEYESASHSITRKYAIISSDELLTLLDS